MRVEVRKMFPRLLWKTLFSIHIFISSTFSALSNNQQISDICELAAQKAAIESGVPLSVLRAISLTETGRKKNGQFQPWPWTVNMEGIGIWFDNYEEAKKYVDRHFDRGARSFDVGCFQINYRWHHQAFSSIEQMFEPMENARYADKFLSELYDEFGEWSKAAGAYHSRTPKYARKYTARFNRIHQKLMPPLPIEFAEALPVEKPSQPNRPNRFPLLKAGSQGQMASLVPLGQSAGVRLIDITHSPAKPLDR